MTPDSAQTPYVTAAEFLTRYDYRLVGQLVSDTGTPDSESSILTDPNLAACLSDASGQLESAALVGGRYAVADLQTLVNGGYVGGSLVQRLVCDLAMGLLRQRRGMREDQPFPPYIAALQQLELLRKGEVIFPFVEVEEAGQISDQNMTRWDFLRQGRVTARYPRFFGYDIDGCPFPQ